MSSCLGIWDVLDDGLAGLADSIPCAEGEFANPETKDL